MPDSVSIPPAVLELLGQRHIHVEPLDSRGEPWLLQTEDWRAVLRRFHPRRYPPEANFAHVAWLHRFLDRLATTGFPAPRPLRVLNDDSTAIVDGAIWEVLSYVPGRALMWDPAVPVESAGSLLARFHQASLAISPADQRPGALPLTSAIRFRRSRSLMAFTATCRPPATSLQSDASCTPTAQAPTC